MTVSVVVPTYGRRDLVTRCLTSLASQDERDFEVIVVDDGADPSLGAHVSALGLSLAVRVVSHAVNRGRSAARNTGIEHASGEVVAFLDGDMTVVPAWVRAHREAHEGGDTVVLGNIVTAPGIRRNAFVEYIDSRGVKKVAAGSDIPSRYFMTGNSSVARPLLTRAGVFDEDFREYGGEDTEMGYRLARNGGRFRYAPDAESHHWDLNTVPEMARRLRRYGEAMLPILVRKIPEAKRELHLDLVEPAPWGRDGVSRTLQKALAAVLCREFLWRPAAFVADRIPRGLRADALFDFVRAAAYLDGYRASLRRRP
jgi:glycosyltransferase involved in cell wall biosynthesis